MATVRWMLSCALRISRYRLPTSCPARVTPNEPSARGSVGAESPAAPAVLSHASEGVDSRLVAEYNNGTMDPDDVIADLLRRQLERIGKAGFYVEVGGDEEGAAIFTAVNMDAGERFHVRAPEGDEMAAAVRLAEMVRIDPMGT